MKREGTVAKTNITETTLTLSVSRLQLRGIIKINISDNYTDHNYSIFELSFVFKRYRKRC